MEPVPWGDVSIVGYEGLLGRNRSPETAGDDESQKQSRRKASQNLPRNLIKAAWFREVATYNPVSYLVEALRSLVIQGWDVQALELGFGFALALAVITIALSRPAMRARLART